MYLSSNNDDQVHLDSKSQYNNDRMSEANLASTTWLDMKPRIILHNARGFSDPFTFLCFLASVTQPCPLPPTA